MRSVQQDHSRYDNECGNCQPEQDAGRGRSPAVHSGRGPIGQVIARPAVEPHALPDFATRSGLRITWQGILRPGTVSGACRDLD